jgi:putative superfamily III holin-X
MSRMPDRFRDSTIATEWQDGNEVTVGTALERVYEAGQDLVIRRIDLLSEELADEGRKAVAHALATTGGAIVALAGWFIAIFGVIGVLDDHLPRAGVEIGIGMLHLAIGLAIAFRARRPAAASKTGLLR